METTWRKHGNNMETKLFPHGVKIEATQGLTWRQIGNKMEIQLKQSGDGIVTK